MDVIFLTLYVISDNFDTSTHHHHHVVSLYEFVTQIKVDYKIFKLKK